MFRVRAWRTTFSNEGGARLLSPNNAEGPLTRDAALDALGRVLSSAAFHGAERSTALLRFVVDQTLGGSADRLKEYTIGVEALGRGSSFDPRIDPIVRAEVSRLRTRLERYYATDGRADPLVISLPKGSYVPQFRTATVDSLDDDVGAQRVALGSRRWRVAAFAIGGALALVLIAVASWLAGHGTGRADLPLTQFEVELRSGGSLGSEVGTDVVISRDGTRLAFVSIDSGGTARLNVRHLDQPAASALPGTEGARGPFFSPDGQWIGFWAAGRLKKVAVVGGSPVVLCDATDLLGASWGDDGTIIAVLNSTGAMWRVPEAGGTATQVDSASAAPVRHAWPQLLPGGTHVLYTNLTTPGADRGSIEVVSLRTGTRSVLQRGGTFGRYLAPGYLTYVNQGTLYAAPFDVDGLAIGAPAVPVLDDIAYSPTFGYAHMDVSQTGTFVYRRAAGTGRTIAVRLDSAGITEPLVETPGRYSWPRLSPDGRRLALAVVDGGITAISFYDASRGRTTRISGPAQHSASLWSPNGKFIVMSGGTGMSWMPADGNTPEPLVRSGAIQVPWTFTPNGDRLAYHEMNPTTGMDLWTIPIRTDGRGLQAMVPEPLVRTRSFEVYPSFSPDGRWVAYGSNESGTWEVYVRPFGRDGERVQVSSGGGRVPRWSPNGRDLFYATDDQRVMIVRYRTTGVSFEGTPPRLWSRVDLADTGVLPNYDLAPDGRIVALVPATPGVEQTQNHVTIMLNFFDELRRRTDLPRR